MISVVVKVSKFLKLSFNWSIFSLSVAIIIYFNTNIIKIYKMAAKSKCCRNIVTCGLLKNSSFANFGLAGLACEVCKCAVLWVGFLFFFLQEGEKNKINSLKFALLIKELRIIFFFHQSGT